MKKWEYLILFLAGFAVTLVIASLQPVPGYMDAEYYAAVGKQIADGKGWTEPFLWNYLDDPAGLPHPANTYWMPLAALIGAAGMGLGGSTDFSSARSGFFVLAGLVPVITAALAVRLTGRRSAGWMAGGLGVFSGFYALYLGLTETFALYMILGSLFLWVGAAMAPGFRRALLWGGIAGLLHLARADGILWLAAAGSIVLWEARKTRPGASWRKVLADLGMLILAYGLVTGFWYGRNLLELGSLFPPGNSKTLWLVDYDQLYAYPAETLNFQNWFSSGLGNILKARWEALITNLQTALAVQGMVFLSPLILVGFWRLRRQPLVQTGGLLWLMTLAVMTVVFPLAGSRGGFLHSGAAFQPLLWALASEGLLGFISLGVRWRNWKVERAAAGFGLIAVLVAALITVGGAGSRLVAEDGSPTAWRKSWDAYVSAGAALERLGARPEDRVLVNDPPGFYLAARYPALVIPDGDMATLLAAGQRYQARYLVLEENTVKELRSLYQAPGDRPGLKYLGNAGSAHIFRIVSP